MKACQRHGKSKTPTSRPSTPHDFDDEEIRDISPSNRILTPITIK